jgi:hypothetical protein
VLQVKISSTTSGTTTNSTSFVETALAGSITPSSTASKVLIIASGGLQTGNTGTQVMATIARGGSNIGPAAGLCVGYPNLAATVRVPCTMVYLDSPASTSAQSYSVQVLTDNGANNVVFGTGSNELEVMILAEIGS